MLRSILPLFAILLAGFALTMPGRGQTETKKEIDVKKEATRRSSLDPS